MTAGIVIPIILLTIGLVAFFAWYRRKMAAIAPDESTPPVSGARLTAERLRTLPAPPWRVVYEIGSGTLAQIDHVVVGPPGVVAIETIVADRPAPSPRAEPGGSTAEAERTAQAAIARGEVSELSLRVGVSCDLIAKVYWGTPHDEQPAAYEQVAGQYAVEGHRLTDWLASLPAADLAASPARVDQVWQAIVTGIGRPDPIG